MVPKTTNRNRSAASLSAQAPATLRDLHEDEPDPRQRSALRRLEVNLGAPLESMSADIDRFDACFAPGGFGVPDMPWISERAYGHWRSIVRSTIRGHSVALDSSVNRVRQLQSGLLSHQTGQTHSAFRANQILGHAGSERTRAHRGNFRKVSADPKSD